MNQAPESFTGATAEAVIEKTPFALANYGSATMYWSAVDSSGAHHDMSTDHYYRPAGEVGGARANQRPVRR